MSKNTQLSPKKKILKKMKTWSSPSLRKKRRNAQVKAGHCQVRRCLRQTTLVQDPTSSAICQHPTHPTQIWRKDCQLPLKMYLKQDLQDYRIPTPLKCLQSKSPSQSGISGRYPASLLPSSSLSQWVLSESLQL